MNDKIMVKRDIVIIGGGPAGLAAALAAKKEGAESILTWNVIRNWAGS